MKDLERVDKIADEALDFFDKVTREIMTPKQIADETGYSLRTVYSRINMGREAIDKQLRELGPKYMADVWRKYDYLWNEANARWKETHDKSFLSEMRAVLEAYRKMQALDAAPKAPVNEVGKALPNTLVMVFDETGYKDKEKEVAEQEQKAIEGEFTVTESKTE